MQVSQMLIRGSASWPIAARKACVTLLSRLASWMLLALVALPAGCVVNSGDDRGILAVEWQPSTGSCAVLGASTVRIRLRQGSTTVREVIGLACEARQAEITLPEGRYTLDIRGFTGTGLLVAQTQQVQVQVVGGLRTPSGQLLLGPGAEDAGSVAVAWTLGGQSPASACAQAGVANVVLSAVDENQAEFLASVSVPCSEGQATLANVPAGTRFLQLDGFAPNDPPNSPSYGNASLYGPLTVFAGQTTVVSAPIDLVPLGSTPVGKGNLRANWTVLGESAASACAKHGLTAVQLRVLMADGSRKEVASVQENCSTGSADVNNLPAGSYYLQLDGVGPAAPAAWGNINLTGPIQIANGQRTIGNKAVDIGKRTVVSLDWKYEDGGSCASHSHTDVYVEVRRANQQVIVPMNDPSARKYCDLVTTDGYVDRVIDLGYVEPQCALPPGAKGLVLCNIASADSTIGVTLSATKSGSKLAEYGGSMLIQQIVAGTHVALPTPILLKPCGTGAPCTNP